MQRFVLSFLSLLSIACAGPTAREIADGRWQLDWARVEYPDGVTDLHDTEPYARVVPFESDDGSWMLEVFPGPLLEAHTPTGALEPLICRLDSSSPGRASGRATFEHAADGTSWSYQGEWEYVESPDILRIEMLGEVVHVDGTRSTEVYSAQARR